MSKVALTKRYPEDWCHRTRIWSPTNLPGHRSSHFSTQFEGYMDPDFGDFIRQFLINSRHADEAMMRQIRSMTKKLRIRARMEEEAREIMES